MADGSYTVSSTISQTIIGRVSAGTDRAQFGFWHTFSSIAVNVEAPPGEPTAFELGNFPNPFRSLHIGWVCPAGAVRSS